MNNFYGKDNGKGPAQRTTPHTEERSRARETTSRAALSPLKRAAPTSILQFKRIAPSLPELGKPFVRFVAERGTKARFRAELGEGRRYERANMRRPARGEGRGEEGNGYAIEPAPYPTQRQRDLLPPPTPTRPVRPVLVSLTVARSVLNPFSCCAKGKVDHRFTPIRHRPRTERVRRRNCTPEFRKGSTNRSSVLPLLRAVWRNVSKYA